MSESLLLSSIFIAIIVLAGFAGGSFGITRGFVMTAAILLGSELALWWGADLGKRISSVTRVNPETGRFLGGIVLLLLTILVLGISGSASLRGGTSTRWGMVLGGALGAANGALLIAIALRLYFMAWAGKLISLPLDNAIVTRVLWRNFDWFLLGFVLIASVALLYTRAAGLRTTIPDPIHRGGFSRPIPPPVPGTAGKLPGDRLITGPTNTGSLPNGYAVTPQSESVDDTVYAPPLRSATTEPGRDSEGTSAASVRDRQTELPSARNTVRYCPNCGMTLDASDHFCPDCGFTL